MTPAADIVGGSHSLEVEVNDISHGSNRLAKRSATKPPNKQNSTLGGRGRSLGQLLSARQLPEVADNLLTQPLHKPSEAAPVRYPSVQAMLEVLRAYLFFGDAA